MKKVFYLAVLIVLAAGLHSCQKDAMSAANAGNNQPVTKAESNLVAPLAKAKPTVTTTAVTAITQTTASSGGNVTNGGGSKVTARGVCWSSSGTPVVTGNHTANDTGTGKFTSQITGLSAGTKYYVRAYATNSSGTAYGKTDTFTTASVAGTLAIGQKYEGGIIAYILGPGDAGYNASVQHGIIAALTDQSTDIQWYNGTYVTTGASSFAIGTGASNTAKIIAAQGAGSYAASVCKAYNGGGYTDWYLPSTDELNVMYLNIGQGASGANANIGGFNGGGYWSSTESISGDAWVEAFADGYIDGTASKSYDYRVRAVRSF